MNETDESPSTGAPGGPAEPAGSAGSAGPAGSALSDPIEHLEQQLSMLWRRSRSISQRVARDVHPEMEPAAYGLLVILQKEGAMRLTDLAANIGIGKPSVSRQISLLEDIGLVRKQADPFDGRAQTLTLTEEGSVQLARTQLARKQAFRNRLAGWSADDVETLAALLTRLNEEYTNEA
ncbi:MarR family winged helix-turn-helix transcriptional regulator [Arthrobacter castelli]|uniref:MarR family winged helix-turn-helix transcriptional regulator n=1 Tax=Arthrobacter castelli TaxID=271431 RepID=UPI00040E9ECC|nr:MarR family winged helix-turn-helix transcriptional regulator [Arthrobacter castelli]